MRSGIGILAVCGAVGLIIRAGVAQDRIDPRNQNKSYTLQEYRPAARSAPQYFSRSNDATQPPGRSTPPDTSAGDADRIPEAFRRRSEPQSARPSSPMPRSDLNSSLKNDYRDLIGTQSASRGDVIQASSQRPSGKDGSTVQRADYAVEPTTPDVAENPFATDNPFATQSTSNSQTADRSQVIHAEHRRSADSRDRGQIQQVRATEDEADNPFGVPAGPQAPAQNAPGSSAGASPGLDISADTGPQTPSITLEWVKQGEINVGQECRFELLVTNSGQARATHVAVDAYFPPSVRLTDAKPRPTESRDHLTWKFDALAPGEKQTIRISMIPSERGQLGTTAYVRFTGAASSQFTVAEPLLQIAVKGPSEVTIGDSAAQVIVVSNPGTGVAKNVTIEAIIPEGLEHARGERLATEVGSLAPGESRTVRLSLAAVAGGEQIIQVQAKSENDLSQTTAARVSVIAPSLQVAVNGPSLRYVGRNAKYTLSVTNDGSAPTNNVRVSHKLPAGFEFVSADKGGKLDKSTSSIDWFVGRLTPGTTTELQVELTPTQLGNFAHQVRAFSEYGVKSDAQLDTRVEGTASLVLEMVDLDDPVEVGAETAYEIRVRNDGSIDAQNLQVTCELPEGVKLIDVKGPVGHVVDNGQVVFKPVPGLSPGKTAIFRVHIRGQVEGNHRCRARLTSDSMEKPLTSEEVTKFYKD
jgi:uncharacterized repeat protein (TIGR01451 family)